jgi:hypothetical protein
MKTQEDINWKFTLPAPSYSTRSGSGLVEECIFLCEASFNGRGAELTSLKWSNGRSPNPILSLIGAASPAMLRELSDYLASVADAIEAREDCMAIHLFPA